MRKMLSTVAALLVRCGTGCRKHVDHSADEALESESGREPEPDGAERKQATEPEPTKVLCPGDESDWKPESPPQDASALRRHDIARWRWRDLLRWRQGRAELPPLQLALIDVGAGFHAPSDDVALGLVTEHEGRPVGIASGDYWVDGRGYQSAGVAWSFARSTTVAGQQWLTIDYRVDKTDYDALEMEESFWIMRVFCRTGSALPVCPFSVQLTDKGAWYDVDPQTEEQGAIQTSWHIERRTRIRPDGCVDIWENVIVPRETF